MYFCMIAKVVDVTLDGVVVENEGVRHTVEVDQDELKEIELGRNYCLAGKSADGRMRAERVILRRFLDPLFEQDVLTASGEFAIVKPIKDPFPEAFKRLTERDEAQLSEFPTQLEIERPVELIPEELTSPIVQSAETEPTLSPEGFPYTGTHCTECKEPQFMTPHGICCSNGHGGADSVEDQ